MKALSGGARFTVVPDSGGPGVLDGSGPQGIVLDIATGNVWPHRGTL